jgi:hypothetical protein
MGGFNSEAFMTNHTAAIGGIEGHGTQDVCITPGDNP